MKKYSKILAPLVLGSALLQLAGCGGGGAGGSGGSKSESSPRLLETEAEGSYVAVMESMNQGVGGALSATVSLNKEGSRLIGYVRLNGGHPRTSHQQRVHVGTRCPTKEDDTNGDGYVDINEAWAAVGKILFPLDADISAQERGSNLWPMGDIYGYYHWERATSYERFINDLRATDMDAEDDYAKLGPNGDLNLDGRVVLIHGANELSNLPETVGTRGRYNNYHQIPIACGILRKVNAVPGVFEDDPSLGPAAEGETVGGSSGVDDGATIPVDGAHRPGETTAGTTGTTNDADNDPRPGGTSGGVTGGPDDDDDNGTGGWRWPWERPRTTTGGSGGTSGSTSGGTTSGGSTSGGTTSGGTTSGGSTSGGETTGGTTSGGTTSGGNYGDDEE